MSQFISLSQKLVKERMNVGSVRYLGVCGTLRVAERVNDGGKRPKVSRELMLCQA